MEFHRDQAIADQTIGDQAIWDQAIGTNMGPSHSQQPFCLGGTLVLWSTSKNPSVQGLLGILH